MLPPYRTDRFLSAMAAIILFSLLSGCASTPPASQYNTETGAQLAARAKSLVGTRYQYGGNNPRGFDCSGLVQYTYQKAGISIPRTTRAQLKHIRPVKLSRIQPGDLIFFRLAGPKASHVGIYIGDNKMIHAPSSGKHVAYARLDANGYWRSRIIATGRFY